jgi:hypothetical protein
VQSFTGGLRAALLGRDAPSAFPNGPSQGLPPAWPCQHYPTPSRIGDSKGISAPASRERANGGAGGRSCNLTGKIRSKAIALTEGTSFVRMLPQWQPWKGNGRIDFSGCIDTTTKEVRHSGRVFVLRRVFSYDRGSRSAGGRKPPMPGRDGTKEGIVFDRPEGIAAARRAKTSDVGFPLVQRARACYSRWEHHRS